MRLVFWRRCAGVFDRATVGAWGVRGRGVMSNSIMSNDLMSHGVMLIDIIRDIMLNYVMLTGGVCTISGSDSSIYTRINRSYVAVSYVYLS
jgi:hypothetical protein